MITELIKAEHHANMPTYKLPRADITLDLDQVLQLL